MMVAIPRELAGLLKARGRIQTPLSSLVKQATTVSSRFAFFQLKLQSYLCPFVAVKGQHVRI